MLEIQPVLSIIVPCYNCAHFVSRTIEMLLTQGLDDCELILVDDGSEDNTLDVLLQFSNCTNVKVLHQENAGVSVARNTGLAAARGRYVYFLDSDDALMPGTLDFYRQVLREHPSCKMFCFGYEMLKDGLLKKRYAYPSFDNHEYEGQLLMQNCLMKKFCVNICSSIYDRVFLKIHGITFNSDVTIGEDMLFYIHVLSQNNIRVFYSSRVCFLYQLRSDSATQGYQGFTEKRYLWMRVLRDYFESYCEDFPIMRPFANYFLCYVYLVNLYRYMRSNRYDKKIDGWLYEDRCLLYKDLFVNYSFSEFVLYLMRLLPIKFILWLFKCYRRDRN